jgi:asparagine synthase (glutamine-hydrolysing)
LDGRIGDAGCLSTGSFPPARGAPHVLSLYETRGPEGFSELIGDWSLAIWDPASRSIVLASDYAGVCPLYYAVSSGCVRWSSCLNELAADVCGDLDEEYIAELLDSGMSGGRTPYRGVYPVPPGAAVVMRQDSVRSTRYWSLPAGQRIAYRRDSDYEDQFRHLFREAVAARLDTPDPVSAELSGGLDSSSVVCVAHQLIRDGAVQARKLVTFSYDAEGSSDPQFYRAVERSLALDSVHLHTDDCPPIAADGVGRSMPSWWDPRFREAGRRMAAVGSGVLLSGRLGDLVTGNWLDGFEQVADHLVEGRIRQAFGEALGWSRVLRIPVYATLWRALRACRSAGELDVETEEGKVFGDSMTPRLRRLLRRDPPPAWRRDLSPARRKHFAAVRAALESRTLQCPESLEPAVYSHPFVHRPLVEFMLSIPPSIVCRPGEPRRLMRRALAGVVPEVVLQRRSKASYGGAILKSLRPLAAAILRDTRPMMLVERGMVDRASATHRLGRLVAGLSCNEPQLRQVILVECWLRSREQARCSYSHAISA